MVIVTDITLMQRLKGIKKNMLKISDEYRQNFIAIAYEQDFYQIVQARSAINIAH